MNKILILAIGAVIAVPAQAQVTQINSTHSVPKARNPNTKICEREQKTGSRLETVEVCMTAQQWADQRQGHRSDLEKVQQVTNGNVKGN